MYIHFESEDLIMGDIAIKNTENKTISKRTVAEKTAEREARKQETVHRENQTIDKIAKKSNSKDKPISARVNGVTYTNFKKICEARGLTSNACLNMLITDFVRENKSILDENSLI